MWDESFQCQGGITRLVVRQEKVIDIVLKSEMDERPEIVTKR